MRRGIDPSSPFARKIAPSERARMEANLRAARMAGSGPLIKSGEAQASVAIDKGPDAQITCSEPDAKPVTPIAHRRGRKAANTCPGCFYSVKACRCAKLGFPNPIKPRRTLRTSPELVGADSVELRKPAPATKLTEPKPAPGTDKGRHAAVAALNELIRSLEEEITMVKRVRDRLEGTS